MASKIPFGYPWAAYKAIEEDMLRVAEYIPLETQQYDVFSFKLADIVLRSCSHIESRFKDVLRNQDLSNHPNQQKIAESRAILMGKERGMLTIKDYIEIFAPYLNLRPVRVLIRRNNKKLEPFKEFKSSGLKYRASPWWKTYNSLKHDFYNKRNLKEGNLGNALEALGALFVLNCKIPFHFKLEKEIDYLVENKMITSPNFQHSGDLKDYINNQAASGEYSLSAETSLFQYWLSYNKKTIGETVARHHVTTGKMIIPHEPGP